MESIGSVSTYPEIDTESSSIPLVVVRANRSARFLIDIAYIGHITINNYKIYLVLCVGLTVCFMQFTRVMDTICIELCVLLLIIL